MSKIQDRLDLRILTLLQEDGLLTADELAEQLPLSASAIARRIRRLRETKTILGNVAVVAEDVQPLLSAVIYVQLDRPSLPAIEALRRKLLASRHVQLYLEVTGNFDLMLVVTVRDIDAFNAFTDVMLAPEPVVRRYETSFVKRRRKFSLALPLEGSAG